MNKFLVSLALISAGTVHAQSSVQDLSKIVAIQQAAIRSLKSDLKLSSLIAGDRVVGYDLNGLDGLEVRNVVTTTANRLNQPGQASNFKEGSCLLDNRGVEQNRRMNSSGSLSITAWIKPQKLSEGMIAAKHYTNFKRSWNVNMSEGKISFSIINTENAYFTVESPFPNDGKWHHIAAVYNKGLGKMSMYVDGREASTGNVGQVTIMDSNLPITVGCYLLSDDGSALRSFFVGDIDNVSVFNRPLSVEQINFLLNVE